jgi:hypothetical protein
MDPIDEIKQLYFKTSAKTIQDDFARAIDLIKALPDEETRAQAAVYMEGLAEMRNEWRGRASGGAGARTDAGTGSADGKGGSKGGGKGPGKDGSKGGGTGWLKKAKPR